MTPPTLPVLREPLGDDEQERLDSITRAMGFEVPEREYVPLLPEPPTGTTAACLDAVEEGRDDEEGESAPVEDVVLPPPPPGAVVDAGELAEDVDAYRAHRSALAMAYGVRGLIEEELLDRVADLSWRLRRLPRVERGAIGLRTSGVTERRQRERLQAAPTARLDAVAHPGGAFVHENPHHIERVLGDQEALRDAVEAGQEPPYREAVKVLVSVFGVGPGQQLAGHGHAISAYLYQLELRSAGRWAREDGSPDASAALAARIRAFLVGELRAAALALADVLRWRREDLARADRAHAESMALPETATLRDLVAYERHLAAELRQARTELVRVVARRRLGEVGQCCVNPTG